MCGAEIYKINILQAMKMAKHAWNSVSSNTIKHCWAHTKVISINGNFSIEETHSEIEEGLRNLQAIGALSSSNTISLENHYSIHRRD
ncbi:uncharacterized protein MELLADRAFT_85894 [Melampsora larici-populina 98AG31]|uniref:DDE-1 domain-containing protein n=1 Tax=Melampsora larici-populina (strain 98AG31 / pathotype 3-4-7) TaxID=747676 RepID=F4RK15_MELLP|nr:uncharacterized protein MELLADRAFT_85894 [Melampsora larici-populina 98AG31]EGG07023.1 hypothetical protein MELLADRAFT_85894 [Melampsora larici-populina 98AG31]